MASIYARGDKLWIKIKVKGRWIAKSTPYRVGEERAAQRYADEAQREIDKHEAPTPRRAGGPTLLEYSGQWLEARRRRGVVSVDDDESRLRLHVFPLIGSMLVSSIRPRDVIDVFSRLRVSGLAPRTIYSIRGVLHTLLKSAVRDELLTSNPVAALDKTDMPKKMDADPTWRAEAIYTRDEVEALISDGRLLPDRRVLYGLKFLAALRHSEAASLTWAQYDPTTEPLGAIRLGKTKSGVPRQIPVHPALAQLLAAWRSTGWRLVYGRDPTPTDLIVPTRNMTKRQPNEAQEGLLHDLATLGLRVSAGASRRRRGHDLRRTLITLAQVDGAQKDVLEAITHGPRGDIVSVYTSWPWPVLCRELSKLKIRVRPDRNKEHGTALGTALKRAGDRWGKRATLTGFEVRDFATKPSVSAPSVAVHVTSRVVSLPSRGPRKHLLCDALEDAIRAHDEARALALVAELRALGKHTKPIEERRRHRVTRAELQAARATRA